MLVLEMHAEIELSFWVKLSFLVAGGEAVSRCKEKPTRGHVWTSAISAVKWILQKNLSLINVIG